MRRLEKYLIFQNFCEQLATLSTCKRAKCAAIVFDWRFERVVSIGYNGPARHLANEACTAVPKACGCIHAEANALLKARTAQDVGGYAMYSTTYPCPHCAGLILNSGIVSVLFWRTEYTDMSDWYKDSKILVINANDDDKVRWALETIK